jgi:two-component system response regulator (stage 0 sporulation protein A)
MKCLRRPYAGLPFFMCPRAVCVRRVFFRGNHAPQGRRPAALDEKTYFISTFAENASRRARPRIIFPEQCFAQGWGERGMKILVVQNAHNRAPMRCGDWGAHTLFFAANAPQALAATRAFLPDAVLTDAVMPGGDGAVLPGMLLGLGLETTPFCAVAADVRVAPMLRGMISAQTAVLEKPVDAAAFLACASKNAPARDAGGVFNQAAVRILDELGMAHHLAGYRLLVWAVKTAALDHTATDHMTRNIYQPLCAQTGQRVASVERNMRFAIEMAWDRGRVDAIWRMFGYTVRESVGKPSNREFIAMAAERARAMARG